MIRLGLCCIFREEPIKFRRTTAKVLMSLPERAARLKRLAELCRHNLESLRRTLEYCAASGIGDFRINSQLFPLYTHPRAGYSFAELPGADALADLAAVCRRAAGERDIRTGFHPDQFNVLSSPDAEVVERSVTELAYQAEAAELLGSEVINIHGGGGYGDRPAALIRLAEIIGRLSQPIRSRLALENDDRTYTPADLIPVCEAAGIPFVYDVHHHRVNPDGWKSMDVTVEVEAKGKEIAVLALRDSLIGEGVECWGG